MFETNGTLTVRTSAVGGIAAAPGHCDHGLAMSLALVHSRALDGLNAPEVTVEVHLANGLPSFTLVGLADTEVKEARERVRAALATSGLDFPHNKRITVNLAPADLPKESGRFDLPIALGILAASGQLKGEALTTHEFVGELSLTGELRPIRGALAMALGVREAGRVFVLPSQSAAQAALAKRVRVLPAKSLLEVCAHVSGEALLAPYLHAAAPTESAYADLSDVKGQGRAKRALEIAKALGGDYDLRIEIGGPPMVNDELVADVIEKTGKDLLGSENVQAIEKTLGAEDFGEFMKHAPGAMFTLGTKKQGHEEYLLHHPKFDIDESAMPIGTAMLVETAMRFLNNNQ